MDDLSSIKRRTITPLHVVIILLSLMMTIGAWWFSKQQIETRIETRFQESRDSVVEILRTRMLKYEDALWAGVSALESHGGDIGYADWRTFANTLRIDQKYPGINGIGVIHRVHEEELPAYLAQRQAERPAFRIHPEHDEGIYMPISFIEPEDINAAAVGLDVAHERNRRMAALDSLESGEARITGPIFLVQDAGHTPGFLFYAPFGSTDAERMVSGAVYAPFVVRKLMEGLLAKERRDVRFSIVDDGETIYDEHSAEDARRDPNPMFSETVTIDLYGRNWVLDIRSNLGFRETGTYAQPTFILVGGLLIEVLIIAMLIMMSKANSRAVAYASEVTASLREQSEALVELNDGLEEAHRELEAQNSTLAAQNFKIEEDHDRLQAALFESEELRREQSEFTYAVSHDLKSPANTMQLVLSELALEQEGKMDQESQELLELGQQTASRMSELVEDILSYSWATNADSEFEQIDMQECLDDVLSDLRYDIERTGAEIEVDTLDPVYGSKTQIRMLLQNLISNGIKFQEEGAKPKIRVESRKDANTGDFMISVQDNGIGIDPKHITRIFGLFQ